MPLPREYLQGLDTQLCDVERGRWTYLLGEWRYGGCWYWYIVAAIHKVPLGYWCVAFASLMTATLFRDRGDAGRRGIDWLALLLPPTTLFVAASSQTNFTVYFRYVLPCLPFAYIAVSSIARHSVWRIAFVRRAVMVCLAWAVASSLAVYPHGLSYMNELCGGPAGGTSVLLDANMDWGQDALELECWVKAHPHARPLVVDIENYLTGDRTSIVPATADASDVDSDPLIWYAISINRLHDQLGTYKWLRSRGPVSRIGYSILIFAERRNGLAGGIENEGSR
jgi:hypothetical protein